LPALKIVIHKSKEILFIGHNLKNLLGFLFLFLDTQEGSESFENLFIFVCEKFQQEFIKLETKQIDQIKE